MPVKGVDYSIENNLMSIKNQKYQDFKFLCVVDSEEDVQAEGKENLLCGFRKAEH